LNSILQDLKYSARTLAKSPGFTIIAVLTLALGIGANTAIFSVVNAVLLRPLPFKNSSQLVVLRETYKNVGNVSVSYPDFLDWRQQAHSFSSLAAIQNRGFNLSGVAQPENIGGYAVSPNLLTLLGVHPILGRDFLPSEEKPGTAPAILLSYQLWQSHLGGDPAAIGRSISLDGRSFSIVGILPPTFRFLDRTDVLVPIGVFASDSELTERGERGDMDVVGRLSSGVALPQAAVEMKTITSRLDAQYPESNRGFGAHLESFREAFAGDTRLAVLVLFGAVVFVLLIACVNVANLFLVRGAARSREIALRLAFGASRARVIRQMLTESLVLAICGGVLGIVLGAWGISGLGYLLPADSLQSMGVRMDLSVFLFAAAIIVLVTFAFGLVPALQVTRPDLQETLKEGGRSATSTRAQQRLRGALVIAETALALVLLVGAGLMLKSLYHLIQVSPGFQPARVLTMEMDLRSDQYSKSPAILNFWQQLLDRVRVIPGVESAAVGTVVPLTGNHSRSDVTIEGLPTPGPGEFPHPDYHAVSSDYAATLGIAVLRGRTFTDADNENAPLVGLVNATMAHRYWNNGDPIGKRILIGHPGKNEKWITIVGVVADNKLYGLDNPARLEVYFPYRQQTHGDMNLVVRSAVDPASLTSAIRAAVAAIDKDQPVFEVHTMQELVDDSISTRRLTLVLLGIFSALALILSAIGIYGVMAYSVALRTQEIGIRMALGAQQKDVLCLVVGQGARIAFFGVAIGLAAAAALARLLSSLLFSVSASDPLTFAAVATLLMAVALIATYVPARRALRVDPIVALRYE
jgi:putative ABC transport system permease protein